ncbi:MAG: hypothetical protein RMK30_08120 [Anaerolineae bacterium]|nr:hypothetical protein [Anaerolineae bacterium]
MPHLQPELFTAAPREEEQAGLEDMERPLPMLVDGGGHRLP